MIKLRSFFISAAAVFTMVSLQSLNGHGAFVSPQAKVEEPNPFDSIRPRLEEKINDFQIKKADFKIPAARAAEGYDLAASYVVLDFDKKEVIAEKNLSKKLPIASLTKLMTAIVTLDLTSDDNQFTVSKKAAGIEPTRMGLIEGQIWNRNELLVALLLTSANDSAESLKEGIDKTYGEGSFIKAMNEKARFLNLKNSSFDNVQGFDGKYNYSSVEDLAVLAGYALTKYPLIAQIVAKDYQFYSATDKHKQADLYNWNGLLGVYPGVLGVKIGNTGKAGFTTVVLSQREGKKVLVVLLGAPGVLERDLWASQLLDLGFAKMDLEPIKITDAELKEKYAGWEYFR